MMFRLRLRLRLMKLKNMKPKKRVQLWLRRMTFLECALMRIVVGHLGEESLSLNT